MYFLIYSVSSLSIFQTCICIKISQVSLFFLDQFSSKYRPWICYNRITWDCSFKILDPRSGLLKQNVETVPGLQYILNYSDDFSMQTEKRTSQKWSPGQ